MKLLSNIYKIFLAITLLAVILLSSEFYILNTMHR